ncbi:MAG: RDD family protein [Bdellovibrio sp.]|nr:RDD family protein [Bdellovibrio sp.]
MNIDPLKSEILNPQRAPLEREAPVPLNGPAPVERIPETPPPSKEDFFRSRVGAKFDQSTGFNGGPSARRKGYKLALWSCLASFIDLLVLISASSFFLFAFSLIMKTSIASIVGILGHNKSQMQFFAEIFFVFGWIYMVAVRYVMGSTIGEWACELRLGQPHERLKTSYVLRVALRSTIILCTGIITLPVLSILLGKDIPGVLSGLRLFSLK